MRTADILADREMVLYDQIGIDNYVILNSNLNDYDTFNNLGLNYGLFNFMELGLQAGYLANDQHKTSGFRSYKGIVKFRLLGNKPDDKYAVGLSAYQTVSPADANDKIGSGQTEDGAEINASYYGNDINLHLTLGSATADAKYYDPDVLYYRVEKQYANLGLEFKVSDKFVFGIEGIQEQSDNALFDRNQIFAFSLQYKPGKNWDFDFGAAFGVPEDRSEPAKSFYVGFNYRMGGDRASAAGSRAVSKARPRTAASTPTVSKSKPAPKPKPTVKKRAQAGADKKPARKSVQASYKYWVKIKNATGSSATAQRVAAFLKKNGYGVASVQSVSHRRKTEIRYLDRNAKQALQLAIKIPGNQNLRKMSKLDKGIDFEVIVGSDLVKSIR